MPKPTNYDELYPGRFLKAGLLKGKKATLTIKDVDVEQFEDNTGKMKSKAILSFVERPMDLVMCKTNGLCVRAMFGKELSNWIGKRITLFAGQWNGDECIRIWGSPDITEQMTVSVELPRRKPFPMVMHVIKRDPVSADTDTPKPVLDPRISGGWQALGWTADQGAEDLAKFDGETSAYLAHLNALIDQGNEVVA